MLLVDLNQDKSRENKYLSNTLLSKIDECLEKWMKIILYLNKRWEYSSLVCSKCNFLYKCPNCDISLSLHNDLMMCHICNYTKKIPLNCVKCNSNELQKVGVWTQQIEKFLKEKYGSLNIENKDSIRHKSLNSQFSVLNSPFIFRLDTDVVKNKTEKNEALKTLHKSQIIIGTKMITTGFDFENVWLVWVILLEQELQIPKYNTEEKVFSNLKQLIWRWWRKWVETEFVVQTFIPESEIIKDLVFSNYKDFFIKTLHERKKFNYPPFKEYVLLEYRDKTPEKTLAFMKKLKEKLDSFNKKKEIEIILNPSYSKKHNQYYHKIILKWDNLREFLKIIKTEIFSHSNLTVIFD